MVPPARAAWLAVLLAAACVPAGQPAMRQGLDDAGGAGDAPGLFRDASGVDVRAPDPGAADAGYPSPDAEPDLPDAALARPDAAPAVPDAGFAPDAGDSPDAGPPPPHLPLYRISTRVHAGRSALSQQELTSIFAEMNRIWWFGGICFELHTVDHDQTQSGGFDLWFVPEVPRPSGVNGVYFNDHDIWSRDRPSLRTVSGGTSIPAARTAAHELGHALTLPHRQDNTNLMASGTTGWTLNEAEISRARAKAMRIAERDTTPNACAPPRFD